MRSDATGMLLVMTWSIFKNSLLVACRALDQLETRTKKSNIKTTRNWPRLTHYLHTVTLTSIVHILQSEQKGLFFFRFGVYGEVLFFILLLLVSKLFVVKSMEASVWQLLFFEWVNVWLYLFNKWVRESDNVLLTGKCYENVQLQLQL